ncbi:unannotated protein [freshwater metagenome]|uniref:Unannotated protein n=1 Tax=freshwater metagenome TaxID=449393 RepID=A0A6J6D8S6_9ZZZZ
MRDVDDGHPGSNFFAHARKEKVNGFFAQWCRGLIQNHQAWLESKRLGDFEKVCLSNREVFDAVAQINIEADALKNFRCDLLCIFGRRKELRRKRRAQIVFDAEVRQNCRVLVHERDAELGRQFWGESANGLALKRNLSRVRLVGTGCNVHERRLACAVFAEQSVHFAGADFKIDVGQSRDAREALCDSRQAQS